MKQYRPPPPRQFGFSSPPLSEMNVIAWPSGVFDVPFIRFSPRRLTESQGSGFVTTFQRVFEMKNIPESPFSQRLLFQLKLLFEEKHERMLRTFFSHFVLTRRRAWGMKGSSIVTCHFAHRCPAHFARTRRIKTFSLSCALSVSKSKGKYFLAEKNVPFVPIHGTLPAIRTREAIPFAFPGRREAQKMSLSCRRRAMSSGGEKGARQDWIRKLSEAKRTEKEGKC